MEKSGMSGEESSVRRRFTQRTPMPRACHTCAVAKVKCVANLGGDKGKCQRCSRLGSECTKQAAVVRNRRQQKTARLAQLEERLESIVKLLGSSQQSVQEKDPYPSPGPSQLGSSIPVPSNDNSDGLSAVRPQEPCNPNDRNPEVALYSGKGSTPSPRAAAMGISQLPDTSPQCTSEMLFGLDLSPEQANSLLHIFQTQMAEHFPFVVIPAGTTAQAIRRDKPFLYQMIILSASSRNLWEPKACRRLVMEYLGLHLLVCEEKSLDLLQGLLVYISWGNYHFFIEGQLTNLLHLAVALMTDLGLNRPPHRPNPKHRSMIDEAKAAMKIAPGPAPKSQTQGLAEHRAFAGCYYLSSTSNTFSKRSGPVPFSSYLQSCCLELSTVNEYRTDSYLVKLVYLEHFVERIDHCFISDDVHQTWNLEAPVASHFQSIERELGEWKSLLPSELEQHTQLMALYHIVGIRLHEFGLHMPPQITDGDKTIHRAEIISACLSSIIQFFENYFRLPTALFSRLSYIPWLHMGYAVSSACKLLLLDVNGWDVHHLRNLFDFSDVLRQICESFEEAGNIELVNRHAPSNGDNAFLQYARWLGWVRTWYESKLVAERDATLLNPQDMSFSAVEGELGLMDFMGVDDAFWQEFMGDWDMNAFQKDGQAFGNGLQPTI
ncbi:hypothetical protein MMC26_006221 [Xylographa opegraphella]|nr:hypothetical protein [Xylographa opegraphella]